ncbi:hypothetical protein SARC_03517 [Sphaeroforma arctica JP610]|uniref:Rab-GAP TBC domain-containing protein n=1 Tax=Sphaeroforma arctica JP610 TaxID=667725 RepID=A0A0L0G5E0_9EUKA|nr:hypothetical protein SARC_03517 [Sphaeroforma arctica JP610]KNC84245.1 hypothetical protein SARC_03517 [Sphaeroforma arctica JP610]|eukprot:XP_014158147.1 hypothetical protein SARC_03517 [Sphaeroforma arctica JP610]
MSQEILIAYIHNFLRLGLRRSQEHLRPLLWKILLGQLPADTRIWPKASVDDRAAYKNLLADVITQPVDEDGSAKSDHPLSSNDDSKWQQYLNDNKLINTIHKDIRRISSDFAFVREWSRTPPPIPIPLHTRLETHSENELSPSHFMYSPASTRDDSDKQPVATGEADALSTAVTPTKRGRGERNVVDTDTEAVRAANEEGNGQVMNRERREKHWEVVERILFVYAKTNVGVGYVQGLTDLVLPLYATMSLATDEQDHVTLPSSESSDIATTKTGNTPQSSPLAKAKHTDDEATPTATPTKMAAAVCPHAECDTFYTFTMLMGGQRNNFIHALDDTELGITGLIERVSVLLKAKDPELSMSLEDKGLLPQYYLFQWLSLLFTRQFPITGVVMVWDRLLAMDDPSDLSVYMCIAMVMNLRNVLISSEFSDAVTLLQNFHTNNPKRLIKFAFSMYLADDHGRNVRRVSGDLLERALSSRGSSAENNGNSLERSESNSSMSSSGRQSPLFGSLSFVGGSTSSTGSSTTSLKNATSSANTSVAGMMQGLSWGFTAKLTAASTKLTEVAGSAGQRLQSLATSATESYSGGSYPGSDSVQKNSRGARLQRDARANAYSRRTQPAKGGSREGAKDVHDIQSSQTKSKRSSTSHSKSNRQSGTGGDSHTWGSRRSTSKINHEISMSEMNEVSRGSGGNSQKSSGMVLGMGSMDAQGDELVDGLYGDWRRRHTSENFELAPNTEGRGYVNDTHKYHKDSGFSAETNDGVKLSFSDDDYVDFPPDLPTASLIEENVLFSFGNEDDELSGEESDVLV